MKKGFKELLKELLYLLKNYIKKYNSKIIMFIRIISKNINKNSNEIEIEIKISDIKRKIGYIRRYENINEFKYYIPLIISKYEVKQIQCEIDFVGINQGYELHVYDYLRMIRPDINIISITYKDF